MPVCHRVVALIALLHVLCVCVSPQHLRTVADVPSGVVERGLDSLVPIDITVGPPPRRRTRLAPPYWGCCILTCVSAVAARIDVRLYQQERVRERVCRAAAMVCRACVACVYAALPRAPVFLQTAACYLSSDVTQVGAPPAEVWGLTHDAAGGAPAWRIPQAAFTSGMVVAAAAAPVCWQMWLCLWAVYIFWPPTHAAL